MGQTIRSPTLLGGQPNKKSAVRWSPISPNFLLWLDFNSSHIEAMIG